jgi:hypothetical protein
MVSRQQANGLMAKMEESSRISEKASTDLGMSFKSEFHSKRSVVNLAQKIWPTLISSQQLEVWHLNLEHK